MKNLQRSGIQTNTQPKASESVEYRQLVNQFKKDEEKENAKNLLFGSFRLNNSEEK